MLQAADLQPLTPALTVWQAYDPAVKADLCSTCIRLENRLFLVDPIPLTPDALRELSARDSVCAVFVTNTNHARAAGFFAGQSGATVLASATTANALIDLEILSIAAGDLVADHIEVIALEGAAEGEIALHLRNDGGSIVLGDALINFEPNGFTLLPAKYCSDQKLMRRSLRQLLDFSFERLLFAHGTPIVSSARTKLEVLLADR
ncbi:MAG: hypothetical protein H0X34_00010 [Chthoniobacterales bacterium]|nr:hypothetical protein [Chthoniobacterales bacterium]